MEREHGPEILDGDVTEEQARRAYRDLTIIHKYLGDTNALFRAIQRDPLPVRRILDIGCATGSVLAHLQRKLGVEGLGVDLKPRVLENLPVPIFQADAVRDQLPPADVAFSMHVGHHLSAADLELLIQNVGKFCRRFIILDLVRHPLPLALFRVFVAPFVCRIVVEDGQKSIRRSYTPDELRTIAAAALRANGGTFRHSVAPLYARQVLDISYVKS